MTKWCVLIVVNLAIPRRNVLNWLVTQNIEKTAELASIVALDGRTRDIKNCHKEGWYISKVRGQKCR